CGVEVSAARSIVEIQNLLKQRLPDTPAETWLRAYGYDEFFLAEKRHPTRWELDAVSTHHPIILRHRTGHAAVLNSTALQRAGIDRHFSSPVGGHIEQDARSGEATGVVYELASFLRTVVPPLDEREFFAGVQQASNELLRQGVTSFHDASAGNSLEELSLFQRLHKEGLLASRATVMMGVTALPQLVDAGLTPFGGNEQVRLGSIKILVHESGG